MSVRDVHRDAAKSVHRGVALAIGTPEVDRVNGDTAEYCALVRRFLRISRAHTSLLDAWRKRRRLGVKTIVARSL
jgi:hypothetical protein